LGDEARLGRAIDVAVLGGCDEVAQISEVHWLSAAVRVDGIGTIGTVYHKDGINQFDRSQANPIFLFVARPTPKC
jgi:hypothetical protein